MRNLQKNLVPLAAALLFCLNVGCSQAPPPPKPPAPVARGPVTKVAPPTPIQVKKVELGEPAWNHAWDAFIERSLPPGMLSYRVPRDVRHFCPRFYSMTTVEKRTFWAYFFQALAGAEAGLDPRTNVRHTEPEVAKVDEVTHRMVRSEGLLQLTYEDDRRYGCSFNWNFDRQLPLKDPAKTILNPEKNLLCGIKILDTQIILHHKPLMSPTGYWSTLHPGTPDFVVFSKQMTNPPAACGRGLGYAKLLARNRHLKTSPQSAAQSQASLGAKQ